MSRGLKSFSWILGLVLQVQGELTFVSPVNTGLEVQVRPTSARPGSVRQEGYSATAASAALASTAIAVALLRRSRRDGSPVISHYQAVRNRVERKWWYVKEDQDPTTLPVWQRDYRYGFQVLRRTMIEARKRGRKVFWDVRVTRVEKTGCRVEMLNSGLLGWMPKSFEGLDQRPSEGDILKVECTACPMQRLNGELKMSPWPNLYKRPWKAVPVFSHYLWLERKRNIKKAKELEAGMIVKAVVHAHCPKGLVMILEGDEKPKGMLDMNDISRKKSSHKWVDKMFPIGTEMKCFVAHSDKENGRITLSTKEFEDDEHVGWMLSFPERCFAMADEALKRYYEKREAYIAWLQR